MHLSAVGGGAVDSNDPRFTHSVLVRTRQRKALHIERLKARVPKSGAQHRVKHATNEEPHERSIHPHVLQILAHP